MRLNFEAPRTQRNTAATAAEFRAARDQLGLLQAGLNPKSKVELANDRGSGRGARVCDPQRIATPEGSGKILTPPTADALRVTDPRSAGKASAPVRTKSASISESGLNAAPRREETGGEIGVLPKRSS